MNQQVFKNEGCLRDRDETLTIDSRLANMNVSSIDTRESAETDVNYPSPFAKQSFEHIVVSRRSLSMDLEERDIDGPVVSVPDIQKKLSISLSRSISISRDYPFREPVNDSREPEEQNYCDFRQDNSEERTSTTNRATQDVLKQILPHDLFLLGLLSPIWGSRICSPDHRCTFSFGLDFFQMLPPMRAENTQCCISGFVPSLDGSKVSHM